MPLIMPNSDIVLCKNVPLDAGYDHTVTFSSQAAQLAYFYSKAFKVIHANSYQRAMKNRLRIECTMEEAVQCRNQKLFQHRQAERCACNYARHQFQQTPHQDHCNRHPERNYGG